MKTIILYCSYTGRTHALAVKKATELDCDMEEIRDVKKPSLLASIKMASKREKSEIMPIQARLDKYDKIIIMSPVWASHPVPAVNSLIECLPAGKLIEFYFNSAGGGTKKSAEGTKALASAKGCEVVGYTDVQVKIKGDEILWKKLD